MSVERVTSGVDLVYSPDDEGYYFAAYGDQYKASREIYPTREAAMKAWRNSGVRWDVR